MRRLSLLLTTLCLLPHAVLSEETPPPHVIMAQRLLSNLPNIPNAIQEGMEGKHGEIRKMVSNVLGDGLISQLVVNPMSIASQFGIDLDQFGINKTLTDQVLGTGQDANAQKPVVPNTLTTGEQGEKIWSSDKGFKREKENTQNTENEPLFVNGHIVDEESFRQSLEKEMQIRPSRPSFVQEKPTETTTTPAPPTTPPTTTTTTKNPGEKMAEKVLNALGKSLFSSEYTSTQAPPTPSPTLPPTAAPVLYGNDQVVVEPEYGMNKWNGMDRRMAPSRYSSPQPAMAPAFPPAPSSPSFRGLMQEMDEPSKTADSVLSYFKNRDISSLTPEDVHILQNYLQTYEQNLQTRELLSKRQKLQQLQSRLNEHKRKMEEQKSREEQLRMQEFELEQQRKRIEDQLKKQLDKWHNSFNTNSNEAPYGLGDFSTDSLRTSIEQAIPPPVVQQVQQPAIIRNPSRSVSTLQNQLRYSPDIRRKPQKQPAFNESEFTSNCECVEVDFERMKGVWMQSLSAPTLLDMQYRAVGRVFGSEDAIPLNCSSISFGRAQQSEAAQDARVTWTFRTENSRKLFRLSGSALTMDHRTIRIQFNDYNGGKTHFPVCALKTSYGTTGPYEYIVLVEANTCKSASLLVRDPETFFDKDNSELIHFLQHKVRENELEEMDVVPHDGTCSVE
uniref:Uncharacterized protein n=1 Tax=Steinernema glaseri TaxID=37863 RepID=A0A1I7Y3T4_9BILA